MVIKGNIAMRSDAIGQPQLYDGELISSGSFQGELSAFMAFDPRKTYDGKTVVVPRAVCDVVLPTKDTYVPEDITVRKVPSFETENASGGKTVYIASE